MMVSVQFHGIHRMVVSTSEIKVPLVGNGRVKDVLSYVCSCYPELNLGDGKVFVLVNNQPTTVNHALAANDRISFLPPVGGG